MTPTYKVRTTDAAFKIALLCLAVFVLTLPVLFLRQWTYAGSSDMHATMEMLGALFGLVAGYAFVLRYYAIGNRLMLFIGLAYIVNGAEDFMHGLLAFRYTALLTGVEADTLRKFIPGTYVTGRILLGVMMLAAPALAAIDRSRAAKDRGRVTLLYSTIAATLAIVGTLIAFSLPLPRFVYPGHLISRPIDLLSAGIIGAAMVVFLGEYRKTSSRLTLWVAASLGINFAGQVIMARSEALFDGAFDLSHVYKIAGYLIPLIGFSVLQIADLRRAEDESTELWQVLDRHTLLSVLDPDGKVVYTNEGYSRLSGYEPEELIGERLPFNDDESGEQVWPKIREELESGKTWRAEIRLRKKEGEPFWVDATCVPKIESGRLVRSISLKFDVDEKKRYEMRLAQASKLESIGQLAAGVAHEINTPMQFILSNTQFLKEAAPRLVGLLESLRERFAEEPETVARIDKQLSDARYDSLRKQINEALDDSIEGANRVIDIVSAMKELSHPGDAEAQSANLNEIASSAATVSKNHWKYVADLNLQLAPDLPVIECRPAELNQVLINLIINAADAIAERREKGGLAEMGEITLRTSHDEDSVLLECVDTGAGISDAAAQRIFDPFFTTKEVGKGSGQGLAISHDIVVNKHGGTIEVGSTSSQGTTFRVRLPLVQDGMESTAGLENPRQLQPDRP